MIYKLSSDGFGQQYVLSITEQGTKVIPFNPDNTDYQAYLKYIEQGGLVLPADAGAGTEEVTPE